MKRWLLLAALGGVLFLVVRNRAGVGAVGANVIEAVKQLTDPTRKLIEQFEGRRNYAYQDSAGIWTFGVGHRITGNEVDGEGAPLNLRQYTADNPASDDVVNALFDVDVADARGAVRQLGVPLTDNQAAALTSLAFNIGIGAFLRSTLVKKLKAGDVDGAAAEFPKWKNAGGQPVLLSRRQQEQEVFQA